MSTSSDSSANSTNYTTAAGHALSPGGVTLSTPAVGVSGVTYSVEFTTSSTGMLYGDQGTIPLTAPSRTTSVNRVLSWFVLTTGQGIGGTFAPGSTGNSL